MAVDREKIAARISEIQTAVDRLESYAAMDVREFLSSHEHVAAAKYYLLTMIEGCISICTHIAAKEIHKVPDGYGACFKLLSDHKLIGSELGNSLGRMAGFRNLLIHHYWDINDQKVHRFINSGLKDIKNYVEIIGEKYLKKNSTA